MNRTLHLILLSLLLINLLGGCTRVEPAAPPEGAILQPVLVAPVYPSDTRLPPGGREYYIATDGTPEGDGSRERPWDITTAFSAPPEVQPGDTVWLRGGKYGQGGETSFKIMLEGSPTAPIIIRQYPGERAILDGILMAYGAWTWYWGFEITNTSAERLNITDLRPGGIDLIAPGQKAINLVIHNTGHPGIGFWEHVGDGGEVYGCLIWGVGLYDKEWDGDYRGSGIYAQNQDGSHLIKDVITFRNFSSGIKIYTETGYADGFQVEGNVSFDNGDWNIFAAARQNPVSGLKIVRNYTYRQAGDSNETVEIGRYLFDQSDAVIQDNVFVGGSFWRGALQVSRFQRLDVSNNLIVSRGRMAHWLQPVVPVDIAWDNNQYFGGGTISFLDFVLPATFTTWQALTGFDPNSQYSDSAPANTMAFLRPNEYEPQRAHLVIYNWGGSSTVRVDLSVFLDPGDRYVIQDAQDYFGEPAASGVYTSDAVEIPMHRTSVSDITGTVTHMENRHTLEEFGAFVLVKGESP